MADLYVIRHKATGLLMPQTERGRGYSLWNPSGDSEALQTATLAPRLMTLRSARQALAAWARGRCYFDYERGRAVWRREQRGVGDLEIIGPIKLQGPESWHTLDSSKGQPAMLPR